mmetsp:Transcript_58745/g.93382  ORF Transcript_58745/g.93382 Transcript_58745/m.93382 type:complete len:170 (+) Transcript_58745:1-510(+)
MVIDSYQNENPQTQLIDIIIKHTILCCIASFTVQIATLLRLLAWLIDTFSNEKYKVTILAVFNAIFAISALFSVHLSFKFANNQYRCMCKRCHAQCYKLCERKVEKAVTRPAKVPTTELPEIHEAQQQDAKFTASGFISVEGDVAKGAYGIPPGLSHHYNSRSVGTNSK